MSNRFSYSIILAITFLLTIPISEAQNWKYTQATLPSHTGKNSNLELLHRDNQGNFYCRILYHDSVTVGDTTFRHENPYPQNFNYWVFAKYDKDLKFVKAIDLHSEYVYPYMYPQITTDESGSVFIAAEFTFSVYLSDSLIGPNPIGSEYTPIVYVAKLNSEFKIQWVRVIASTLQIWFTGFYADKDNNLILAAEHSGNGATPGKVWYFGQDSVNYLDHHLSLLKLSTDGNLIWRSEVNSLNYGPSGRSVFLGDDGFTYLEGNTFASLIIGNDTLLHPHPNKQLPFIVKFDTDGKVVNAQILDLSLNFIDLKIDAKGDRYFSCFAYDTCYFGQDTIIQTGDTVVTMIGKMNSLSQPYWFDFLKVKTETNRPALLFRLALTGDSLTFATTCGYSFTLHGKNFNVGTLTDVLVGQYSPDGDLLYTFLTDNKDGISVDHIIQDDCKDLFISGMFKGETHFGKDTLIPRQQYAQDGYLACIERYSSRKFHLGRDTILRSGDEINLMIQEGYQHYLWSTGVTTNTIQISGNSIEPGLHTIWAKVMDANCLISDTINIVIINNELIIYPNPTAGMFYLDVFSDYNSIKIFNYQGQLVYESTLTQKQQSTVQIDIGRFSGGMYTIQVQTQNGMLLKKIVLL